MSLWGNRRIANNAPVHDILGGIGGAYMGNTANGYIMFANTKANEFHANMTVGVWAAQANVEQVTYVTFPSGHKGSGYRINDALTLTDTGAVGANASLTVNALAIVTAVVGNVLGTGYANGDIIQVNGTGIKANISVASVGNSIIGNVSTIAILSNGAYTANILTSNVATTNVTGAGVGFTINVATGIASVALNNAGSYTVRPSTTANNVLTGGNGTLANGTLTFIVPAVKSGGAGWVLRKVREDGKTTYEILVAGRSFWNGDPNKDKGAF